MFNHRNATTGEADAFHQGWQMGVARRWMPIASAPKDREVLVYASPAHGLPGFASVCAWHADAGWCVDELRPVTHWQPLPAAPREGTDAQP